MAGPGCSTSLQMLQNSVHHEKGRLVIRIPGRREWHSCFDASYVGSYRHNPMKINTPYPNTRGTKPMRLLQRWFCGELSCGWQADRPAFLPETLQLRQSLRTTKTDRHVNLACFIYPRAYAWFRSALCPRFHWQVRVSVMNASSFLSLYFVLGYIELQARITTAEEEGVNIFSTKAKLCEAVDVGNRVIQSVQTIFCWPTQGKNK